MNTKVKKRFEKFANAPLNYTHPTSTDAPDVRYVIRPVLGEERIPGYVEPKVEDIEAFIILSETNLAIAGSNPELTPEARRKLYKTWWQRNNNAFLMLERVDPKKTSEIVAISIILPLTDPMTSRLLNQEATVIEDLMNEGLVAQMQTSNNLLIDTWIIKGKFWEKKGVDPLECRGHSLILKHISMFWNPDTQLEMSILAEPDVRSMTEFLKGANFVGPRYTKKRSEIYVHQLPEKYCPEETLAYINAITAKIRQFR